jgi:tRNA pseudouridine38-40 synthase
MNEAAKHFLGTQDFTSLAKLHSDVKTNSCTVTKAFWEQETETTWYFEISADRFLRNMVRSTVGTLLEVGLGKIESKEIRIILDAKDRSAAAKSVAAHGLYLCDVKYHFDNY